MQDCKRCSGKGFGSWRTNFGRCFLCGGKGEVHTGVKTTRNTVSYGPSGKGARIGSKLRVTVTYVREAEVRGLRMVERLVAAEIVGTDQEGRPFEKTVTGAEACEAVNMRLAQNLLLLVEF